MRNLHGFVAVVLLGCGGTKTEPPAAELDVNRASRPSRSPVAEPKLAWRKVDGVLAAPRSGAQAIAVDDRRAVVFGGYTNLAVYETGPAELVELASGATKPVIGTVPNDARGARIGDRVVVVAQRGAFALDVAKLAWEALPAPATARSSFAVAAVGDGLLVLGGFGGADYTASAERLDAAAKTWKPVAPMLVARGEHAACVLTDGRVLVTGGIGKDDQFGKLAVTIGADGKQTAEQLGGKGGVGASAEVYDPKTDRWTLLPPLPTPRRRHICVALPDGGALLVGGLLGAGSMPVLEADRFTAKGAFARAGETQVPLRDMAATLLADGRVLVAGGANDDALQLAATELYDPATGLWSPGPALARARTNHALVTAGGKAYALAGQTEREPLASIEALE